MTKRKKIVWLCILAVVAVCAAVWLWPRSMETVAGIPEEQVVGWTAAGWMEPIHLHVSKQDGALAVEAEPELPEELLAELYTFRFARPIYGFGMTTFRGPGCIVLLSDGEGDQVRLILLCDGTIGNEGWRYQMVGGKQELERLNRWFDDMLTKRAGS